jgi:hypothetical protein
MAIIPNTSEQKIALLCAEINSLRNTVASNGSTVLKYDNALKNAVNTVLDVCKQFNRGVELAKDAGDILSSTVNGDTPVTEEVNTFLNTGLTKLPTVPLAVGDDVKVLMDKVNASDLSEIDADMELFQYCQSAPQAFQNVSRALSFIPDSSKTDEDKAVDSLLKTLDIESLISATESNIQGKAISNNMSNMKESITEMGSKLAQQTKVVLDSFMPNLNELNPFTPPSTDGINGLPLKLDEIPGLNSESLTKLTQAGNLSKGSSALFYAELGCEIAKEVGETIDTVNELMYRFETEMPSDTQVQARLDKEVRQQFNKLLHDLSGLTIGELEILKQECGALFGI